MEFDDESIPNSEKVRKKIFPDMEQLSPFLEPVKPT